MALEMFTLTEQPNVIAYVRVHLFAFLVFVFIFVLVLVQNQQFIHQSVNALKNEKHEKENFFILMLLLAKIHSFL